jgi:hypothetical protein
MWLNKESPDTHRGFVGITATRRPWMAGEEFDAIEYPKGAKLDAERSGN